MSEAKITPCLWFNFNAEEAVAQSMVFASEDYAEMKSARANERVPRYRKR